MADVNYPIGSTVEGVLDDYRKEAADLFIDLAIHQENIEFPLKMSELWEIAEGMGEDCAEAVAVVLANDFDAVTISREDLANWIQRHAIAEFEHLGHEMHREIHEPRAGGCGSVAEYREARKTLKEAYEHHEEVRMLMS